MQKPRIIESCICFVSCRINLIDTREQPGKASVEDAGGKHSQLQLLHIHPCVLLRIACWQMFSSGNKFYNMYVPLLGPPCTVPDDGCSALSHGWPWRVGGES